MLHVVQSYDDCFFTCDPAFGAAQCEHAREKHHHSLAIRREFPNFFPNFLNFFINFLHNISSSWLLVLNNCIVVATGMAMSSETLHISKLIRVMN